MSEYAHVAGGSLKFKGGDSTKKKKKKSHSSTERKDAEVVITESSRNREREKGEREKEKGKEEAEKPRRKEKEGRFDDEGMSEEERDKPKKATGGRQMTEAERKFEEIQRKRRAERVAKTAKMSHKDRVTEFNSKLDKLTEHNDIPKISWTG